MEFENGYIKIHRSLLKWEWFDDPNTFRVFMYLLLAANWEDKRWHGQVIHRGQLKCSRNNLSKRLGISTQSVRTALEHLKSTGEITIESSNQGTLITVANYEKYQAVDSKPTSKSTRRATCSQPTGNQQVTTTEERKERKESNNHLLTIADAMTEDEFHLLESKVTSIVDLIDLVDEKLEHRSIGEIKNPYRYCVSVAKANGMLRGKE